jgi:DNA repair ATPase RecN
MTKSDDRLKEISNELNEHIIAVKGTLELVESSVSEGELNDLLLKAIERMDTIQRLSNEMVAVIKSLLERMEEIKTRKPDIQAEKE